MLPKDVSLVTCKCDLICIKGIVTVINVSLVKDKCPCKRHSRGGRSEATEADKGLSLGAPGTTRKDKSLSHPQRERNPVDILLLDLWLP